MKTLKLHLIRHGATDANYDGRYIGCGTDLPLSPEGLNELRLLKETQEYPHIERLYTSPMLRCRQTAAVLYPNMEPIAVNELREYDFGAFEGKTAAELEGHPSFMPWASGKLSAPPNGEENSVFIKRICLGFNLVVRDMLNSGAYEGAVIMHGGAVMMLLGATAVPRRKPVEWMSDSGGGYTVRVTPSLYHKSGIIEVISTL